MVTRNGDSLAEPTISIECKTPPYLHPSIIDKTLHENHKSKPMGTTTYKYLYNLDHSIPSPNLS